MVPTKTSRAAKEVINEMPIFQSKPKGSIAGSINFPILPTYECSNFSAAFNASISLLVEVVN